MAQQHRVSDDRHRSVGCQFEGDLLLLGLGQQFPDRLMCGVPEIALFGLVLVEAEVAAGEQQQRGDPAGGVRHGGDRCECPAHEPPAHESGEQGDQCQPDPGPEQQLLENRVLHHAHDVVAQPEADSVVRHRNGDELVDNRRRGHRNVGARVFRGRPVAAGCDQFYAPDPLNRSRIHEAGAVT